MSPSQALQAESSRVGPGRRKQAERRSDPRASEGVLVNWVFAPSGAQGAELRIVSGGCADGEARGSKYISGEPVGGGIVAPQNLKPAGIWRVRTPQAQCHG